MTGASDRRQTIQRATADVVRVLRAVAFAACALVTTAGGAPAQEPEPSVSVSLNSEERAWLANHQPIRLGLYRGGWAPGASSFPDGPGSGLGSLRQIKSAQICDSDPTAERRRAPTGAAG